MTEIRGNNNRDVTEICGVKIEDVKQAIREELKDCLGAWRENMDRDEFAKDPVAYIEEKSGWLEAPFEVARYAKHFAKDEAEAAEAAKVRDRAEARLRLVLAGVVAELKYKANGIRKETIRERAQYVLDNDLLPTFETFDALVAHLGKPEKRVSLNI